MAFLADPGGARLTRAAAKNLTPEERKKAIAAGIYKGLFPGITKAMENDPNLGISNNMLKFGTSTAPLQGGIAEGIARVISAGAGGYFGRKEREPYTTSEGYYADQANQAMERERADLAALDPQVNNAVGSINGVVSALTGQPQAQGFVQQGPAPPVPKFNINPQQGAGAFPSVLERNPTQPPAAGVASGGVAQPAGTRVLRPGESARADRRAASRASFEDAYAFTRQAEGGYNRSDPRTGQPVNYGIDQRANPDVNVASLTPEGARKIMHDKYWVPSGAAALPADLAKVHFDTYVLNPSKAKQILAESNGDVATYLNKRRQFLTSLGGPTQKGWANRDAKLARSVGVDPASVGGAAGGTGGIASGEVPQVAVPQMPEMPAMPEQTRVQDPVKSARMAMAQRLLGMDIDAAGKYMLAKPYYDEGLGDEQKAAEDQWSAQNNRDYMKDQMALSRYGQAENDIRQAQIDRVKRAEEFNLGMSRADFEADRADARAEANNAAAQRLQDTKPQTGLKPTGKQSDSYISRNMLVKQGQSVLTMLGRMPKEILNIAYDSIDDRILQRYAPLGVPGRAEIRALSSKLIKDIAGATVTDAEYERLKPWVPLPSDTPAAMRTKVERLMKEAEDINAEYRVLMPEYFKSDTASNSTGGGGKPRSDAELEKQYGL